MTPEDVRILLLYRNETHPGSRWRVPKLPGEQNRYVYGLRERGDPVRDLPRGPDFIPTAFRVRTRVSAGG